MIEIGIIYNAVINIKIKYACIYLEHICSSDYNSFIRKLKYINVLSHVI